MKAKPKKLDKVYAIQWWFGSSERFFESVYETRELAEAYLRGLGNPAKHKIIEMPIVSEASNKKAEREHMARVKRDLDNLAEMGCY